LLKDLEPWDLLKDLEPWDLLKDLELWSFVTTSAQILLRFM